MFPPLRSKKLPNGPRIIMWASARRSPRRPRVRFSPAPALQRVVLRTRWGPRCLPGIVSAICWLHGTIAVPRRVRSSPAARHSTESLQTRRAKISPRKATHALSLGLASEWASGGDVQRQIFLHRISTRCRCRGTLRSGSWR